jgi:2-haloacid dehalogenase
MIADHAWMRRMMEADMSGDRWVTFDCFGTLIDWHEGWRAALRPLAGERVDALLRAYHDAEPALEADRPHRPYRDVLTMGLVGAARSIGLPLAPQDADVLVRAWGEQPLYGDVPAGLGALRAAGWKIGVLTNCDDALFALTVARHPVLVPDCLVTAEQVGSYKPALGNFERFERRTGVARANWVHAAVSWFHDIVPARTLGLGRIWVDRDRSGHDPAAASVVIHDVAGLPAAVAALKG